MTMTQRTPGWHRVTIEWSDGHVISAASQDWDPTGIGPPNEPIIESVGFTLGCVLHAAGLPDVETLAEALAHSDLSDDNDARNLLIAAAARYLQNMRRMGSRVGNKATEAAP